MVGFGGPTILINGKNSPMVLEIPGLFNSSYSIDIDYP